SLGFNMEPVMINKTNNNLRPGRFVFSGYLGKKVDTLAHARLLDKEAWDTIYPETEDAFRHRVDDTMQPGRGFWQGEFWGKYVLSAVAATRYYNDSSLEMRLREAAEGLIATQDRCGYIGTYSDSTFLEGNTWNLWCRKYTLWGLIEIWRLTNEDFVLEAATRLLDHLISQVGPDRTPIIRTGNFYGLPSTSILQPVVEMYRITGNENYLNFALYITEQWGQHPEGIPDLLRKGLEDQPVHQWFSNPFHWAKGYEFVSCVEGLLELYRVVGDARYLKAVLNIQAQLEQYEQSFIGSISFDDKLVGAACFKNTVSEICDNIYWNRLNYSLYQLTGEKRFMDLFESTLYNGLLVGMKPDGSWGLRRQRTSHEHIPATPHCSLQHHQCCTTNLPRGLFQAGEAVLAADDNGMRIGLYESGKGEILLSDGRKAWVEIKGNYPFEGKIDIRIKTSNGEPCPLRLRKPRWSTKAALSCAGRELEHRENSGWLEIESSWRSGQTIELVLGPLLRSEKFDPTAGIHNEEMIAWHRQRWAQMGYISEDGSGQHSTLKEKDALDQSPALAFFLGPLALARDVRLGDTDIFSPFPETPELREFKLQRITDLPDGIEKAWTMTVNGESFLSVCDYPSAGNTWDASSCFATWIDLPEDK
ncbi:MAG: beta-L-arabinofuranosidase domain-containing protein, partial [Candidatus Sumerlaeota bacterium]